MVSVHPHLTSLAIYRPSKVKAYHRKSTLVKRKNKNKKCKKSVMFDPQQSNIVARTGSTTWLSSKEYESIRREAELTIVILEQTPDMCKQSPKFCSRGLEDFWSTETDSTGTMANCLKPEVLDRRMRMIRAVLDEQESHRKERQRADGGGGDEGKHQHDQQQQQQEHDGTALRKACLFRSNRENVMRCIERGLKDAEQARTAYKEGLFETRCSKGRRNVENARIYW